MISPAGHECRVLIKSALSFYQLPDADNAIRLLEMITAWESGDFSYVKQKNGPALGLIQMEPNTFKDVCRYLEEKRSHQYPKFYEELPQQPEHLIFDPFFCFGLARIFFLRFQEPIPDEDQIELLAQYAKKYWNTPSGKANWKDYYKAWLRNYT